MYDREYENEVIQLAAIANQPPHVIERVAFRNCTLMGPAVVTLLGGTELSNSSFSGDVEAVIWEIPNTRPVVVGAIGLKDCLITGCTLSGIGFAVAQDQIPQFWQGLGIA